MSLDTPQANENDSQDRVTQVTTDQPKFLVSDHRSMWLAAELSQNTLENFRRIIETNFAVTRALCDMTRRQHEFLVNTTAATLAGVPGAVAQHFDVALTSARDIRTHHARLLEAWITLERPSQAAAVVEHSAKP